MTYETTKELTDAIHAMETWIKAIEREKEKDIYSRDLEKLAQLEAYLKEDKETIFRIANTGV
jgi:succinate dehydrogenase/fumarate reductase flavoprotein subunit